MSTDPSPHPDAVPEDDADAPPDPIPHVSAAEPEADPIPHAPAAPVRTLDRIRTLDVLRGVALLGILIINVYAFAMPKAALDDPSAYGGASGLDLGTWYVTHIAVYGKFISIFAMLFGAGLVLMGDRLEREGFSFRRFYYRRTFWLLVFGIVHAYFIWWGDILVNYALCGFLIYLFRKRAPRTLITWGVAFFLLVPVSAMLAQRFYVAPLQEQATEAQALVDAGQEIDDEQQAALDKWTDAQKSLARPTPAKIDSVVTVYRSGSYIEIVTKRAPSVFQEQLGNQLIALLWLVGGIMLIGMGLMKTGVLAGRRSTRFYVTVIGVGYAIGIPLSVWSAWDHAQHGFSMEHYLALNLLVNEVGNLFAALGHVGVVVLMVRYGILTGLQRRLAAVGRTALSNYLLTSIVFTAIFYGWGFDGLFGQVNRFPQMGFVVAWWIVQLTLTPIWLRHFRYGPAEWLWRSLTYGRRVPLRLGAEVLPAVSLR